MRVMVTGAAGMLGADLSALLRSGHTVVAVDIADFDITDPVASAAAVRDSGAQAVIHCAAFTDVEKAETHGEAALAVNARGSRNIAAGCRKTGARLYLISTDFVFDGLKGSPYVESDRPNPLSQYGRSKLEGEQLARRELGEKLSVVRTAWLYGGSGENFLTKLLRFAARGNTVRVVDDQYGSPTWTVALAECLARMLKAGAASPLYHAACTGRCARFEMAREWFRLLDLDSIELEPVGSDTFPSAVSRPVDSTMAGDALEREGIGGLPPWREALGRFANNGGKELAKQILGG